MLALSLLTAVLSALLDNVTTVLLIVPVTLSIADQLEVDPIPFLFSQIIMSNIGGTATRDRQGDGSSVLTFKAL